MRGRWYFALFLAWQLLSTNLLAKVWQVPFSDTTTETKNKKVAVILGAGPGGLIAANVLLRAKRHDVIIIVEKRPNFSRYNMVNFFPETWPMLRKLSIADDFSAVSTATNYFGFYFDYASGIDEFTINAENAPDAFDYRAPVRSQFARPRVGLQVVELAALQHQLSMSLARNPAIQFVEGNAEIARMPDATGFHKVHLKTLADDYDVTPDLIIIAEGAHSVNRAHLGIAMKPVLKPQLWCSGSLSIAGIGRAAPKFIQVVEHLRSNMPSVRTFGIFNVRDATLFLNGQATNSDEPVEACLERNAVALLDHLPLDSSTTLKRSFPERHFARREFTQGLITIVPSKATRFSVGKNVLLFGDAAGYGTPKGGIGLSMVASAYPQALLDLLEQWHADRTRAIKSYEARVGEIVDYWHDRIASDDKVL